MQNIWKLSMTAAFMAALLAGCGQQEEAQRPNVTQPEMPAVNDENCKPESIAKLDESIRQKFTDACVRRGSFKPSEGKEW
jgi:entry exclusion lipoprotein TrbK